MRKSHPKVYLASTVDTKCCICNDFVAVSPAIHHCSSLGNFLGFAHSNCNLRAQRNRNLPVLFHKLSRDDAHLFLKSLIVSPGEKLAVNSSTDEVYISCSLRNKFFDYKCKNGRLVPQYCEIRFLDSFQLMSQGLEGLAKTMQTPSIQLLRTKVFESSEFDFENTRDKFFSLATIWRALKNILNLFLRTGTLGETVRLEKQT